MPAGVILEVWDVSPGRHKSVLCGTNVTVYIWGNLTAENFTPRLGKGHGWPAGATARIVGFGKDSAWQEAQGIDTDRLKPPLRAFPDRCGARRNTRTFCRLACR